MADSDIRWKQRLSQYEKALGALREAVDATKTHALSRLEKQGLVKAFEFTHELAWNLMKDYLAHQGVFSITGSRDACREAFSAGLIEEGAAWMNMIPSRNLTAHTYNEATADQVLWDVVNTYHPLFERFLSRMKGLAGENG